MLDSNIKEMLKGLTESEIATLISLAYKEKQDRAGLKEGECQLLLEFLCGKRFP